LRLFLRANRTTSFRRGRRTMLGPRCSASAKRRTVHSKGEDRTTTKRRTRISSLEEGRTIRWRSNRSIINEGSSSAPVNPTTPKKSPQKLRGLESGRREVKARPGEETTNEMLASGPGLRYWTMEGKYTQGIWEPPYIGVGEFIPFSTDTQPVAQICQFPQGFHGKLPDYPSAVHCQGGFANANITDDLFVKWTTYYQHRHRT